MSKLENELLNGPKRQRGPCVLEYNPVKEIAKENTRDCIKFMVTRKILVLFVGKEKQNTLGHHSLRDSFNTDLPRM